jgi:hypothetical protein
MTPQPLPPLSYLNEALEISAIAPSGLVWKSRPREHFRTHRGWKISNTRDAGRNAGNLSFSGDGDPRYMVKINQLKYPAHRVVFALANERDPYPMEVDHIDRNSINNHPSNLRTATRSQNASNRSRARCNISGVLGVTFCKRTRKWMAQLGLNKKTLFLGRFDSVAEAAIARREAEEKHQGAFAASTQ